MLNDDKNSYFPWYFIAAGAIMLPTLKELITFAVVFIFSWSLTIYYRLEISISNRPFLFSKKRGCAFADSLKSIKVNRDVATAAG